VQEFQFAIHLGLTYFAYIKLKGYINPEVLGKFLMSILPKRFNERFKFYIEINLVNKQNFSNMYRSDVNENCVVEDSWSYWNKLHQATNFSNQFEAALVFSSDIPDRTEVLRWLGENISMIVITDSSFITNSNNYAVLPKVTQEGEFNYQMNYYFKKLITFF
jgi:PRMT5 TIM barrel domain